MPANSNIKRFWRFLNEDTWQSWLVSLVLIVVFIKFIFFPAFSFVAGTPLPLVIVESCSMYHDSDFDDFWNKKGAWYEARGITKEEFMEYPMKNGFTKGDIIFIAGRTEIEEGDIIVYTSNSKYPLIHRVVDESPLGTKGDNNHEQLRENNNPGNIDETDIEEEQVLGEAKFKAIPFLGWVKLIWFEPFKSPDERGMCR